MKKGIRGHKGKYALIRLDKLRENKNGVVFFIFSIVLKVLKLEKYIEYSYPNSENEFFVLKLKDVYSSKPLRDYALAVTKTNKPLSDKVLELHYRSGSRSRYAKEPD